MYPTQMRRHKIIRIGLILFTINQVINVVFGVPVTVQENLEGWIDADGTEDGTVPLQKRVNVAGQTPPSSDRTEADRLWQKMGQLGMDLRPRRILAPTSADSTRTPPTPPMLLTRATPQTPPNRNRPYSSYRPNRPYDILLANPRVPVRPYIPVRPNHLISLDRPVRPFRPYVPIPLYYRPYRPVRPFSWTRISPPPPPKERPKPASSLVIDNPSTIDRQLTPQQNSGLDLDVHPPLNPEPHPLSNQKQPPLNQEQPPPNQEPRPPPSPEQPPPTPEQPPPTPEQPPPNQESHILPSLEQPPPNLEPHPPASGETAINEALDMLKNTKIKRTFPVPVQ